MIHATKRQKETVRTKLIKTSVSKITSKVAVCIVQYI